MKKESLAEIFGWIGMVLILLAYFLVSYKFVLGDSPLYQIMNLVGVCGTFYNAYYKKSKPLMALQLIWGIIALISIIQIYI